MRLSPGPLLEARSLLLTGQSTHSPAALTARWPGLRLPWEPWCHVPTTRSVSAALVEVRTALRDARVGCTSVDIDPVSLPSPKEASLPAWLVPHLVPGPPAHQMALRLCLGTKSGHSFSPFHCFYTAVTFLLHFQQPGGGVHWDKTYYRQHIDRHPVQPLGNSICILFNKSQHC